MAEYPEFNFSPPNSRSDIRIDTSFTSPQNGGRDFVPESSRDRYSRQSSQARARDVTWISASHSQLPSAQTHTPQTTRYIPPPGFQQVRTPTPVLHRSGPTSDSDVDYFNVTMEDGRDGCDDDGDRHGYGFSEVVPPENPCKSEKRNFVGGFVNGLRRLPKVMSRSRLKDHKPDRHGILGATDTGRTTIPLYRPSSPPIPKIDTDNIPVVERLGTPPRATSITPPQRLSAVDENTFDIDQSRSSDGPQTLSDIGTSMSSRGFEPRLSGPLAISTPVLAEPRPSADFQKMEDPRPPPEESVASQLARIRRFFRDLNGLPWIAPRDISEPYLPGQSPPRRRYSRQRAPKQSVSWYTPRNPQALDLLAGPSTTGLLPPQQPTAHQAPSQTPQFVLGSNANIIFTQPPPGHGGSRGTGGSRSPTHEGPLSTDSHGSQGPPMYAPAYVATPLFVYPSGLPQPGSNASGTPPEAPRPVYMVASSLPQFMDPGNPSRTFMPQPSGLRTPVL
ncbi:hypothetical protein EDC04DRAFT_1590370 [Pisolithus marmoratus]|nr:hypothetical protein EDC04DRAFT_1590370 [Pisolithus marmoratus]